MLSRALGCSIQLTASITSSVDRLLKNQSPTKIIVATLGTYLFIQSAYKQYRYWNYDEFKSGFEDNAIRVLAMLPYLGPKVMRKIDKELASVFIDLRRKVIEERSIYYDEKFTRLQAKGMSSAVIMQHLELLHKKHKQGKCSGAVYTITDEDLLSLLKEVWGKTAYTNPMHSDWPLINLMRSDVLSICHDLLNSPLRELLANNPNYVCLPGIMTTGGTTSIEEACKAYIRVKRNQGYDKPVILAPETVHAALDKSKDKLYARLIKIPVDPETGQADLKETARLIRYYKNEVAVLVGSAPSFPYGIMDNIPEMARIAQENAVYMHVDSCLGGFLTPFLKDKHPELPACDFSVPGVSSISLDTHKYAQAPKGTSVLVFHPEVTRISSDPNFEEVSTAHVHLNWQGGMYVTQDSRGSQSGADIAVAWTTLHYHGWEFYTEEANKIFELRSRIEEELSQIEGIEIVYQGSAKLNVVGIRSSGEIDLLQVQKYFNDIVNDDDNGWSIQNTQTKDLAVDGLHYCITSVHAEQESFCQKFCQNFKQAIAKAKESPEDKTGSSFEVYKKFKKGVPSLVQDKIGKGYAGIDNMPINPAPIRSLI